MGEQYNQLVRDYEKELYAIKDVLEQRFKEQPHQEAPKSHFPFGVSNRVDEDHPKEDANRLVSTVAWILG